MTSVVVIFSNSNTASAATSDTLNFQGRLTTNTGSLVPDGSYNIQFNLYSVASGGVSQWTETRLNSASQGVTVRNGYFSVYLGDVSAFPSNINWDQELWLGMTVRGSGSCAWVGCLPADNEMTPRFKLTAVPYAFRAGAITDALGNAYTGDDLIQKSPATIQAVNSALAAIRLNQAGSGGLLQLQSGGSDVFSVGNTGNTAVAGSVTIGTATQAGALILRDGAGNSTTIQSGALSGNLTFTFPVTYGSAGQCLKTNGSGALSFEDCDGGDSALGTTIIKTATDTITNDVTLNDDDELFFAVGANETWAFRFVVQGNSATQPDFQFAISAPTGSTCRVGIIDHQTAFSNSNVACGVTSGLVTGTGANEVYEIVGTVTTGVNAGNVALQWAQNSLSANATSVLVGSYVFATSEGAANQTTTFEQGGNMFGATAVLGTDDAYGLDVITSGATALSFAATGEATFFDAATFQSGITLTGGLDNNSGGITEVGALSGVSSIASTNGLTITSGGSGSITLDAANDILVLADSTLRRSAAGTTVLDLFDGTGATTFSILNSDATQTAGLSVEGTVAAADFSGSGASLTGLNAANITSGTLSDSRLSSNVALLNQNQTFSEINTFSSGLIVGNSTSTTAGAIRWNGTDFEGYDGIQWITLGESGGGGGSASPALTTVTKPSNESINSTTTPQNDDHLFFSGGANETWSYRFVIQANSPAAAGIVFSVTAPSGSVCQFAVIDQQTAASQSNLACGATSITLTGTGVNEVYEVVGTVVIGATPGTVRLQWAQGTSNGSNTTVLAGSYLNASIAGGSQVFLNGGNNFGGTAVLGTTQNNDLNFIVNNGTVLSLTTAGQALFGNEILANNGLVVGNAASDGFTIVSDSVTLQNGLNFDSGTLVINAANNRVGIGDANPDNQFSINAPTTVDTAAVASIATNGTTNKGLIIQGVASQTANLFEVQNNTGTFLSGFNASGGLVLGLSTITSTAIGNQTINFGNESGTVCLSASASCGFLAFASASFSTDATNNNSIAINKTGASGNLIALRRNGSDVFTVNNSGALQIQTTSTTALDVRSTAGTSFFAVDTSTGLVRVGSATADATGVLFVLDTKNTTGDPAGQNGGMYYNSSLGKFRCYENGAWEDCITTAVQDDVTLASAANSISLAIGSSGTNLQCYIQTPGRSAAGGIFLRFNNVSTGNPYTYNVLQNLTGANNNTTTQSSAGANQIQLTGTGTSAGTASMTVSINNFTTNNKVVDWTGSYESGATPSNFKGSGAYVNTTNAITSVQFVTSTGNFNTGTRAWCEAR